MENLKNYLLEKLDSEIKNRRSIIKDFIRKNYWGASNIKFDKNLTEDGKIIVNGLDIQVKNKSLENLTTNDFVFGEVLLFTCIDCKNLKSLEGAPLKCGSFFVTNCPNINSLDHIPTQTYGNHKGISFTWYNNGENFNEDDFEKVCGNTNFTLDSIDPDSNEAYLRRIEKAGAGLNK